MSRKDIKKLIERNNRRLQKLKEQQASFGLHTLPHILTEIEDIEAELEKLQLELMKLDVSMRDSHIRFFGGIYIGLGLFLLLAATHLHQYQTTLHLVFALIFIGGLARLTMMRPDIIFGPDIIGSLLTELILMPILYIWLLKIVKSPAGAVAQPAGEAL